MKTKGVSLVEEGQRASGRSWKNSLKTEEEAAKGNGRVTGYLLALQPLLKLHSKLLGSVCSGSHDVGPRVHSLERKTALLVHLIHHRVKRW